MAKATQIQNNIRVELARLQVMELDELRTKWRELYGKEPPDCGKVFFRRQLAFRIQELQYGGISESAQTALTEIGNTPKPRKNAGGSSPEPASNGTGRARSAWSWRPRTALNTTDKHINPFPERPTPSRGRSGTGRNFSG